MPKDDVAASRPNGVVFPNKDFSRVPYAVFADQQVYDDEQRRIFRGPVWSYVGLEAEMPSPGDFKTTAVGDTPVIVQRGEDGKFAVFVNRCAHRGTTVRRECFGNSMSHTCVYHQWTYDTKGALTGLPYRRGVKGKGGYSKDFKLSDHPMTALKVDTYRGVVFASFDHDVEPLSEYLGETMRGQFDRMFCKPIKILGYHTQSIKANWKLYLENLKDPYHSGLLHYFLPAVVNTFRVTMKGGMLMDDKSHAHSVLFARMGTEDETETKDTYKEISKFQPKYTLNDTSLLTRRDEEFDDDIKNLVYLIFPNLAVQQILNTLATRQVVTFGPEHFELRWTYFGFEDDDEEMQAIRIKQSNLIGPAGLFSMEDGEAMELVQRAARRCRDHYATVELGGLGPIEDSDYLITEVSIRGLWKHYCHLMGLEAGART